MKQVKCPHCNNWTPVVDNSCSHCGKELHDTYAAEREERSLKEKNSLPVMEVPDTDSLLQKLWKKPVQWAQLIFLSVISLIAAIASSTVH